jgi:hypothetical protein
MEHVVVHRQPSPAFLAVDRIVVAAVQAGWEHQEAFEAAMMLVAAGVSAAEAEKMFAGCGRWQQ